jgi:amidophosphoribosyltransferase
MEDLTLMEYLKEDKLKEECGVIGVYSSKDEIVSQLTYYGLFALQHRGQESAGIAVKSGGKIKFHKNMGLVSEVFDDEIINDLTGGMATGHVRYSTTGDSLVENAQPLVVKYKKGSLAISHNGNLTNADALRDMLENTGVIFQTSTDTEVVANLLSRHANGDMVKSVKNVVEIIKGAFAFVIMTEKELIGIRDQFGLRPLCIGKRDDGYLLASESCAITAMGGKFVRDVEPGEIVVINDEGLKSIKSDKYANRKSCVFEYIYFARPDSTIDGINVYEARYNAGKQLAKESPVEADLVFSVPDSGTPAAIGYAQSLGIQYGLGLIKNRYAKRTFIQPKQDLRDEGVKIKLSVLENIVKDKRVVIVDDSIVRGTTSKRIVKMVRDAGAKEVHIRVASPPVSYPCYFGIDTPYRRYLIGSYKSIDEITEYIGADSVRYLTKDGLMKSLNQEEGFCLACLDGNYPMEVPNFE